MKKNRQNTIWILVGVIGLALLFSGAYAYFFYEVKVKSEEASLVSDELNEYLSKGGTINILKTSIKNTSKERKKIEGFFVKRDDLPRFTKEIESLGDLSGTKLVITGLFSQGNILFLNLSSEGSFQNTLQLVSLIESLPFKVEITKAYIDMVEKPVQEKNSGGEQFKWRGNFSVEITGFVAK